VDFSKISSLDDLKKAVTTTGLQHKQESKTRSRGIELKKMLNSIEKLEDKEIFQKYFNKVSELISKYKSKSIIIKKLAEIVYDLSQKDINVAKEQIEDIITIFEDPRFVEKHKKHLINILTGKGEVDLDKFYDETKRAYAEYESSFAQGSISPFNVFRTSPELSIIMVKNYSYNNVLFSASEFNSEPSDISKVLYIINKLKQVKIYGNVNDTITHIVSSLHFGFKFNYSPDNVKADLLLKESLTYQDRTTKKIKIIGSKGEFVEVKYKPFDKESYLSEFFKVDATNKNATAIGEGLMSIPNVTNGRDIFDVFMTALINNLVKTIKEKEGDKIINHLTDNLAGMIFKNDVFIPKENIAFYWNNTGYANRARLSIWYKVTENPQVYKMTQTPEGYTRYVYKP
jgi:hypothetical protein